MGCRSRTTGSAPAPRRGFTYLGVLFILVVLSLTAAMASVVWSTVQQRENERQLVFVGLQFRSAIDHYQQRAKGSAQKYPRRLEDLLRDPRAPNVQRDLRQIYPDPITGEPRWGLLRLPDGGIIGVHSLSERKPLQRSLLAQGLVFPRAASYRDWRFVAPSALAEAGLASSAASPRSGRDAASQSRASQPGSDVGNTDAGSASDDMPVASVPRPSQQDYRTRTPQACDRIAAFDQQICRDQAARFGEEAGNECQESAVARTVACSLGEAGLLLPLTTRD